MDSVLRDASPALDRLGMPLVAAGNFAYVFKLKVNGGARAVRCFSRYMGDRAQRYKAIDAHLDSNPLPKLAGFEYDPTGILVRGQKYPILVMEWINGAPLDTYIRAVLQKKEVLLYLADEWSRLIGVLGDAKISHGDLQHGNILVQDGQLRLVDFDGMYVDSLKTLRACEIGHRNYQHPRRTDQYFNPSLDNFASLVIYVSLIALASRPTLWSEHNNGENLIFLREDFLQPSHSIALKKVRQIDSECHRLADIIERACYESPEQTPSLTNLIARKPGLPAWMRPSPAGMTIGLPTREQPVGQAGETKTPPPPDLKRPVAPARAASPAPLPMPLPSPPTISIPSPPKVDVGAWFKSSLKRAGAIAVFAGIFLSWLWFPFFKGLLIAMGMSPKSPDLGLATICLFAMTCLLIGLLTSKRDASQPGAITGSFPTPAPSSPYSPPRPYPSPIPHPSPQPSPSGPTSSGGLVVGSTIRLIYHRPACEWAQKIGRRNRVSFPSPSSARSGGYRPCRVCHPG
jgi:serine/threonine protein kinase